MYYRVIPTSLYDMVVTLIAPTGLQYPTFMYSIAVRVHVIEDKVVVPQSACTARDNSSLCVVSIPRCACTARDTVVVWSVVCFVSLLGGSVIVAFYLLHG